MINRPKSTCRNLSLLGILALNGAVWANANDVTAGPARVNLRPKFTEGRTARYSVWTQRNIANSANVGEHTRSLEQQSTTKGEVSWAVKQVHPDGSASCAMIVHWMAWTRRLPNGSVEVNDSRQ